MKIFVKTELLVEQDYKIYKIYLQYDSIQEICKFLNRVDKIDTKTWKRILENIDILEEPYYPLQPGLSVKDHFLNQNNPDNFLLKIINEISKGEDKNEH